jgi:tRNA threonylcarbamoyladenosine biosynthesis protein TsaB
MNFVAIDTSLEACSVGVVAGSVTVLRSEEVGRAHQVRLFTMMQEAMAEAGVAFDALDRIGVTIGPGSFTGIRIGVAAARGLALVTKKPIAGVTTLAVHAESAAAHLSGHPLLAVLPARGDQLYAQLFAADLSPRGAPRIASADELAEEVRAADAMLAGAGADAIAPLVRGASRVVHRNSAPEVDALVRTVRRAAVSSEPPKPLYLRPPDAVPQPNRAVARQ